MLSGLLISNWLARPNLSSQAFGGSWLMPILGIIFLPFTTLMYVILWSLAIGLTSWEWVWLVFAVGIDVGQWGSPAYYNRSRISGYSTTSGAP